MDGIVNLRAFRKKQKRQEKASNAELNRRKHGRTKAEAARDERENNRIKKLLDSSRINDRN